MTQLQRFIDNEVRANVTGLVEMLFEREILYIEDVVNLIQVDHDRISEINGDIWNFEKAMHLSEDDTEVLNLQLEIGELERDLAEAEEGEVADIMSWYLVTNRLASDLAYFGEPILRTDYGIFWGRTTFGQLIEDDYVFTRIAKKYNFEGAVR